MISPGKFRRLAAQTAAAAAHAQDSTTKQELLRKARLRLRAAKELERMGFRESSAGRSARRERGGAQKLLRQPAGR